jgi:hypothetical protein
MSWIMLPVVRRLCTLRELQDGTYDIADVALMNDALEVEAENADRARAAQEKGDG